MISDIFLFDYKKKKGLYSGLGWSTLGRSFSMGARFGVYEILSAFYKGIDFTPFLSLLLLFFNCG